MLGIEDPWIWSAYLLCFAATLGCILYGILFWNKGDDSAPDEGAKAWEKDEEEVEEAL